MTCTECTEKEKAPMFLSYIGILDELATFPRKVLFSFNSLNYTSKCLNVNLDQPPKNTSWPAQQYSNREITCTQSVCDVSLFSAINYSLIWHHTRFFSHLGGTLVLPIRKISMRRWSLQPLCLMPRSCRITITDCHFFSAIHLGTNHRHNECCLHPSKPMTLTGKTLFDEEACKH